MQVKTFSLKDGATLTAYLHTFSEEMTSSFCTARPAAIVCPGGAYMSLSDREADPPALEFLNMGFQSFILRYHVGAEARHKQPPTKGSGTSSTVPSRSRWSATY